MALEEISADTFAARVLQNPRPVLVDFRATWCGPCQMLTPELEKLAQARPDIDIVGIDVDRAPYVAADHGISSIPALLLFRNGEEVARCVGYRTADALVPELGL
jgi:thioredoxin 1